MIMTVSPFILITKAKSIYIIIILYILDYERSDKSIGLKVMIFFFFIYKWPQTLTTNDGVYSKEVLERFISGFSI